MVCGYSLWLLCACPQAQALGHGEALAGTFHLLLSRICSTRCLLTTSSSVKHGIVAFGSLGSFLKSLQAGKALGQLWMKQFTEELIILVFPIF